MSTRLFFSLFLILSYSDIISQSFENISLINNNIKSYSLNEANAYLSADGNTLYFNSSNNSNNIGGLADMNDVWYRNKVNNVWGSPINLSVVNTSDLPTGCSYDKNLMGETTYIYVIFDFTVN